MIKTTVDLIIETIRLRRLSLAYSQEYMAAKLGVGQNCYSKIELGKNVLTVQRLIQICELLDLNAGELLNAPLAVAIAG